MRWSRTTAYVLLRPCWTNRKGSMPMITVNPLGHRCSVSKTNRFRKSLRTNFSFKPLKNLLLASMHPYQGRTSNCNVVRMLSLLKQVWKVMLAYCIQLLLWLFQQLQQKCNFILSLPEHRVEVWFIRCIIWTSFLHKSFSHCPACAFQLINLSMMLICTALFVFF